jgi:hypothetical protein|tara:strand:- start:5701 stop:5979 length:279 start_codon:yes stop_codon:yes gene_type:complete
MKLQQMIEYVQKHHPELSENEIITLCNQAQDEFCARTLILDGATKFNTVSGQRFYGLKDEILEIKSVDFKNEDGDTYEIKRLIGRPKYRDID